MCTMVYISYDDRAKNISICTSMYVCMYVRIYDCIDDYSMLLLNQT